MIVVHSYWQQDMDYAVSLFLLYTESAISGLAVSSHAPVASAAHQVQKVGRDKLHYLYPSFLLTKK